jgi:hypothetical protein
MDAEYKEERMQKIGLMLVVFMVVTGIAYAKGYEMSKQAGSYTVAVKMDKNPPIVGSNGIAITVKDASGKAVTDAKVSLEYGMPAMPGMPAMHYKAQTALKGESYVGTIDFSMSGAWSLNIRIARGGKTDTLKLNVDVR